MKFNFFFLGSDMFSSWFSHLATSHSISTSTSSPGPWGRIRLSDQNYLHRWNNFSSEWQYSGDFKNLHLRDENNCWWFCLFFVCSRSWSPYRLASRNRTGIFQLWVSQSQYLNSVGNDLFRLCRKITWSFYFVEKPIKWARNKETLFQIVKLFFGQALSWWEERCTFSRESKDVK